MSSTLLHKSTSITTNFFDGNLIDKPIGWLDIDVPPNNLDNNSIGQQQKQPQLNKNTPTTTNIDTKNNNENIDTTDINNLLLDDEDKSEVILSVIYYKLKLGIAYYNKQLSNLYLCECWEDDSFNCFNIVPSRSPQKFLDVIYNNNDIVLPSTTSSSPTKNQNNEDDTSYSIHISKHSDFSQEQGKTRLLNLKLPCKPDTLSRYTYLEKIIDFEKSEMLKATGGLLSYLSKYLSLDEFESLENLHINEIIYFSFDHFLQLDTNTLYSLQIFSNENHPSCYSIGNSKEGLSLFGILDKTKSTIGKRLLKSWFIRPSRKRNVIEERFDLIGFFNDQGNSSLKKELNDSLKYIKNLQSILNRLSLSQNSSKDLIDVYSTLHYFLRIKFLIGQQNSTIPFLSKILSLFPETLSLLYHKLETTLCIDDNNQITIKEGVDSQLDQLRSVYNSLDQTLSIHGEEEKAKLSDISWIKTFHLVYYPQFGCLIAIPVVHGLSINTQNKTNELNEYFGDIHNDLLDILSRIEKEIVDQIIGNTKPLIDIVNYCAELDCILSLATSSLDFNFTRPTISNQSSVFEIKNGKHPLQELCVQTFIPNDTSLNESKPIILVSGPNHSGKSIYLKQVAIIVFLTHLGCYVPAESAEISLCDRIFTRISSRESSTVAESTFMLDCKQISLMTRFATPHSLLVIDEYGKGTNPKDGISILYGILCHFLSLEKSPKIIMCTHFYELFDLFQKELLDRILFCTMEFDIKKSYVSDQYDQFFQPQSPQQPQSSQIPFGIESSTFTPLYRLQVGTSNSSFGLSCAKNANIPIDIIKRANDIIEHQKKNKKINSAILQPIPFPPEKIRFYNQVIQLFDQFDTKTGDIQNFLKQLNNIKK
eukprot:gene3613-4497_t